MSYMLWLVLSIFTEIYIAFTVRFSPKELNQWEDFRRKYSISNFSHVNIKAFLQNLQYIHDFNKNETNTFKLGLNEYAHLTDEEYKFKLNKKQRNLKKKNLKVGYLRQTEPLPKFIDWRDKNVIGSVKNQGTCGSCYTFSTTSVIAAHLKWYRNITVELSQQQLLDCSSKYGNDGCSGGLEVYVYQYIMENDLLTENLYPYNHFTNQCRNLKGRNGVRIKNYMRVGGQTDDSLMSAIVFKGPVATGFDSRSKEFKLYQSGIFQSNDCSKYILDHSVAVVGYSLKSKTPYYIVKNSYGPTWGESGYIRVKMQDNHCGIATDASFPIV